MPSALLAPDGLRDCTCAHTNFQLNDHSAAIAGALASIWPRTGHGGASCPRPLGPGLQLLEVQVT